MFLFLITSAVSDRFAVLVAGSETWSNYRHQADIFTLYQKLIDRGYNSDNIIMFAVDDVAESKSNPYKGKMFHNPDHKINYYPGSDKINFKGKEVTPKKFMDVLTTELKSTTADDLFIYFDDHGSTGFLCFPQYANLYADELSKALVQMEKNGKYGRCLFGIEACFSGSVAKEFNNSNMITITAANMAESSYADVFDSDIGNYLSNEFTNAWLDEMDRNPKQTIGEFYSAVSERTTKSHSLFFGDKMMKELPIEVFFGKPRKDVAYTPTTTNTIKTLPIHATYSTLLRLTKDDDPFVRARARIELNELQALSRRMDLVMDSIAQLVDKRNADSMMNLIIDNVAPEYFVVARHFNEKFGKVNTDDMSKYIVLNNLVAKYGADRVISAINEVLK